MVRSYPQEFLREVPAGLRVAERDPTDEELSTARSMRGQFLLPNEPEPYMDDVVRAFRLLAGMHRYVEVGSYDKGNLAYVAGMLGPEATLVDVDVEARPGCTEKLKGRLGPRQGLRTVVGDSTIEDTYRATRDALDGQLADAVFIDGNHIAEAVMADYSLYSRLVRPGGLVLFHDVYWPGDEQYNGVSFALQQIDRFAPIYVVFARDPMHRFLPFMSRERPWGGVGIIVKEG